MLVRNDTFDLSEGERHIKEVLRDIRRGVWQLLGGGELFVWNVYVTGTGYLENGTIVFQDRQQ